MDLKDFPSHHLAFSRSVYIIDTSTVYKEAMPNTKRVIIPYYPHLLNQKDFGCLVQMLSQTWKDSPQGISIHSVSLY